MNDLASLPRLAPQCARWHEREAAGRFKRASPSLVRMGRSCFDQSGACRRAALSEKLPYGAFIEAWC